MNQTLLIPSHTLATFGSYAKAYAYGKNAVTAGECDRFQVARHFDANQKPVAITYRIVFLTK